MEVLGGGRFLMSEVPLYWRAYLGENRHGRQLEHRSWAMPHILLSQSLTIVGVCFWVVCFWVRADTSGYLGPKGTYGGNVLGRPN